MIDKKYEEQGFGRQTIDSAMYLIRTFPFGKAQKVWLSYEPENTHAKDIYEGMVNGKKKGCLEPALYREVIAKLKEYKEAHPDPIYDEIRSNFF